MTMEVNNLQSTDVTQKLAFEGHKVHTQKMQNESIFLEEKLQEIKDEQGFIGKAWNGIKEFTNLGVSQSDCESVLEKYNNGEMSFEEALEYIETYGKKQDSASELITNIATGIGAIAVATTAVAGGPIGWAVALAEGAPIGAALKTGVKFLDRATNNVEGDALDVKQMAKDAISGGVTGMTSAVTSGVGAGVKIGKIGTSIANGTKCGAACGAISGATSYITDVAFDDKEFNIDELLATTAFSSFASGAVGGAVGAGIYGNSVIKGAVNKEVNKSVGQIIASDSSASSLRKYLKNSFVNSAQA